MMKQQIKPFIFFTPTVSKRIFIFSAVFLFIAFCSFAIFYDVTLNKAVTPDDRSRFQQTVQIWVGDHGIIYLTTWMMFLLFTMLCLLTIRDYIPLWLIEFRNWSQFTRDTTTSLVYTWNQILRDPQFGSLLALLNKSIKK
jgi:hypothetical protein